MRRALLFPISLLIACAEVPQEPSPCASGLALDESCVAEILDEVGTGGKADEIPALQGVRIRREGNRTYFSIPLARTAESDRRQLLDKMIEQFTTRMGELNQTLIANGVDLSGVLTGTVADDFAANYTTTMDAIVSANTEDGVAVAVGETVEQPRRLSTWQRYVVPQAFLMFFSAKASANLGIGAGASATVIVAVQPWLTLAIDHTLPQPVIVDKQFEVDVGVMGVPNVDVGFGLGGGGGLRLGVGAVFGPLDRPQDLAGTAVGIDVGGTIPVLGGLNAKVVTILKYPPLVMGLIGYASGTSAEVSIHGNLQQVMDLESFLSWLRGLTR
jgi:hypothetical protein